MRTTLKLLQVWIQISGASLLSGPEVASNSFGNASPRKYNDLEDKDELHEIIASSPKRVVDRLVTGLHTEQPSVRTAMIYGPMIYGAGRGSVKQRSIQIPDLAKATLRRGHGVHIGKGLSIWSHIHVSDITQLVLKLVAASQNAQGEAPLWNKDGIYFADAGNLVRYFPILSWLNLTSDSRLKTSRIGWQTSLHPRTSSRAIPQKRLIQALLTKLLHMLQCCSERTRRQEEIAAASGSVGSHRALVWLRRLRDLYLLNMLHSAMPNRRFRLSLE